MKRVVLLYGGKSGEHEVSLASAGSILRNLDPARFDPILVGIEKTGGWRLQPQSLIEKARAATGALSLEEGKRVVVNPGGGSASGLLVEEKKGLAPLGCDVVFPVLHGTFGEDGTIQGLLETAGLPYVGAPVLGSALGMDKEKAKRLWLEAGLPTVPFLLVRRRDLAETETPDRLRRSVEARFEFPVFVKPVCTGSSVGTAKVSEATELIPALRAALEWDEKALIEPFIHAREIECAVLGDDRPEAFPPGEVVPSHEFYSYEAKYIDPDGARLEIPARLSAEQAEKIHKTAIAAYRALDLCGMARVDFFIDTRTGEVLLNEVNSIPGFTSISMYPKMCEAGGLPYPDLVARLIDLAVEHHAIKEGIRYSY